MFIQGDLQAVFDALFSVGAIDPVLKMDWSKITEDATRNQAGLRGAFEILNSCGGDKAKLIEKLHSFEPQTVNYIAVEVAREFAEFTSRNELH